jgi:hypothetical protein
MSEFKTGVCYVYNGVNGSHYHFKHGDTFFVTKRQCAGNWVTTCGHEIAEQRLLNGTVKELNEYKTGRKFGKSNLKDGYKVKLRSGVENLVINGCLWRGDNTYKSNRFGIDKNYSDDLYKGRGCYSKSDPDDIMKVYDNENRLVFQREDEAKEVTLKLTQAQIDSLKEQGVI